MRNIRIPERHVDGLFSFRGFECVGGVFDHGAVEVGALGDVEEFEDCWGEVGVAGDDLGGLLLWDAGAGD